MVSEEGIYRKYPGMIRINLLPSVCDLNVSKRLLACALSALKVNSVTGVHVVVGRNDHYMRSFLGKLGFSELPSADRIFDDARDILFVRTI